MRIQRSAQGQGFECSNTTQARPALSGTRACVAFPDPALAEAPHVPLGHSDPHRSERPGPLVMRLPSSGGAKERSSWIELSTSQDLSSTVLSTWPACHRPACRGIDIRRVASAICQPEGLAALRVCGQSLVGPCLTVIGSHHHGATAQQEGAAASVFNETLMLSLGHDGQRRRKQ